jgi:hypothetical protein
MSGTHHDPDPEPTEFTVVLPPLGTEEQRPRFARQLQSLLLKHQMNRLGVKLDAPVPEFIESDEPIVIIDPNESRTH